MKYYSREERQSEEERFVAGDQDERAVYNNPESALS